MTQHANTLRELTHQLFDGEINAEEYRRAVALTHPHPHGGPLSPHATDVAVYSVEGWASKYKMTDKHPVFISNSKLTALQAITRMGLLPRRYFDPLFTSAEDVINYIADEVTKFEEAQTRHEGIAEMAEVIRAGKPNKILFCTPEAEARWPIIVSQVKAKARAQKLFPNGLEARFTICSCDCHEGALYVAPNTPHCKYCRGGR